MGADGEGDYVVEPPVRVSQMPSWGDAAWDSAPTWRVTLHWFLGHHHAVFAFFVRRVDGSIDGVVQVYVDITQMKRAEGDLREHRERLEELVAERTAALSQEIAERERAEQALARNQRLAAAGEVAMVTDLVGEAEHATPGAVHPVQILDEIDGGGALTVAPGARITIVYLDSGAEYTFAGPARLRID